MPDRRPWPEHLAVLRNVRGQIGLPEATALYDYAKAADTGCIVEVGSYRGRSAVTLALGTKAGHDLPVFAVDPHETFTGVKGGQYGPADRRAFYRNMLRTGAYEQVRLLNTSSEIIAPGWKTPVSLLWIDGDHTFDGVQRDIMSWLPHLIPGAVIAFDDILPPGGGPDQVSRSMIDDGTAEHIGDVGTIRALRLTKAQTQR